MLDMDEYTRKYAEGGEVASSVDLAVVLEKLREALRQQVPLVRDIFRRFDLSHNGVIALTEFKSALQKFGFALREREVLVLMRHFDARQDGHIGYNEFCDAVLDEDYTVGMLVTKSTLDTKVDTSYETRARDQESKHAETGRIRRAVREIGNALYERAGAMTKFYKECGHMTHMSHLTVEQIHAALSRIGLAFDLEDVMRCVVFVLPGVDLHRIDYAVLGKTLRSIYHDMAAGR